MWSVCAHIFIHRCVSVCDAILKVCVCVCVCVCEIAFVAKVNCNKEYFEKDRLVLAVCVLSHFGRV